jgi:hypothetical protein
MERLNPNFYRDICGSGERLMHNLEIVARVLQYPKILRSDRNARVALKGLTYSESLVKEE